MADDARFEDKGRGPRLTPKQVGTRSGVTGHLLCAVPQLTDPNFARSVVLVLSHGSEGALGLILNQPLDANLGRVARSIGLSWRGSPSATLRVGGPVEPTRGWILHDDDGWDPLATAMGAGLYVTASLDEVRESEHRDFGGNGRSFVFLLGYAGWESDQLDAEIAAGSWVLVPVNGIAETGPGVAVDWLFQTAPDEMWEAALAAIGVDPARLVGLNSATVLVH